VSALPSIFFFEPDAKRHAELSAALFRIGVQHRLAATARQLSQALASGTPDWLVVHAEPRSAVLGELWSVLDAHPAAAEVPIALVAQDEGDQRFLGALRFGVIAVLPAPFDPPAHLKLLQAIAAERTARPGTITGEGDGRELARLVEHLRRMHRAGTLVVDPGTPEEGQARFANGALAAATHLGDSGLGALVSMAATPRARWTFTEEAPLSVAAPPPAAPTRPPTIEVDVGPTSDAEIEVPIELHASRPEPREPHRLLLVDDDEALCRMFGLLFRKHGFAVSAAHDGIAGYELALSRPFDVVVADLNMPRLDGWGLLRLLRHDHRTRELPVAFLTCHDNYRESLKAHDSGAQGYLSKGMPLGELAAEIKRMLEPRTQAMAALATSRDLALDIGSLGPQWLVRALARLGASARLEAKDGWATHQLTFLNGDLVDASGTAGRHKLTGHHALRAFIASRTATGEVHFGEFPIARTLGGPLEALLGQATGVLNEGDQRLREGLLVAGRELQVNQELYQLYTSVGPPKWVETARLICEQKLAPREVIARGEASPVELEEIIRDLLRRGVVVLSA
jgi:CheY-like chemotaxis protein